MSPSVGSINVERTDTRFFPSQTPEIEVSLPIPTARELVVVTNALEMGPRSTPRGMRSTCGRLMAVSEPQTRHASTFWRPSDSGVAREFSDEEWATTGDVRERFD